MFPEAVCVSHQEQDPEAAAGNRERGEPTDTCPQKGGCEGRTQNQTTLVDVGFPNGICWPFCVKLVA